MSENILLMSGAMLIERSSVHGNTDTKLIEPTIKVAQDMYIMPLLGSALYTKLITIVADGTITSNVANIEYKTLLDKYIVDALIYYTISEMPLESFQFWNKGMARKVGIDTELPSMAEMFNIIDHYKKRAEFYGKRMIAYIKAYADTKFPEYLNPGNTCDTVNPSTKAYTFPIWLGGDDDCGCDGFNNQPYRG